MKIGVGSKKTKVGAVTDILKDYPIFAGAYSSGESGAFLI